MLKRNSQGPEVAALVEDLRALGYFSGARTDVFDLQVAQSVRALQMQGADIAGRPLVVDGIVGPVTRWVIDTRLGRLPRPRPAAPAALPAPPKGGSATGRAALAVAMAELAAGHGEVGGDNRGPHVRRYLSGLVPEGSNWCAGFVSFCFRESGRPMPFTYSVGARDILRQMKAAGHLIHPTPQDPPQPGDIIVWWRGSPTSWMGHIGLVHSCEAGVLRTVEGNKTPKVGSFVYTLGAISKLLGFARAP